MPSYHERIAASFGPRPRASASSNVLASAFNRQVAGQGQGYEVGRKGQRRESRAIPNPKGSVGYMGEWSSPGVL